MIALWAVGAREYLDGNSRHMPTCCPESGDHSARYVYRFTTPILAVPTDN